MWKDTNYWKCNCNALSPKFFSSTSESHVNDSWPIIENQKKSGKIISCLKVHNGMDWSLNSLSDLLYFMWLQRIIKLDTLIVMSHAAGYSAYNNIKHIWSPLSNSLTGLFSLKFYQGKIKLFPIRMLNKQKRKQRKLVYLITTTSMNLCINLKTVQTIPVHCEEKPKFYNVHQNVFKLMRSPISSITQDKANISLVKKFWFLLSHIEKKHNDVVFSKCFNPS